MPVVASNELKPIRTLSYAGCSALWHHANEIADLAVSVGERLGAFEDFVPEEARGHPAVGIVYCYVGPPEEGAEALRPLRAVLPGEPRDG